MEVRIDSKLPAFFSHKFETSEIFYEHDKIIKDLKRDIEAFQERLKKNDSSVKSPNPISHAYKKFMTSTWCYGISKLYQPNWVIFKIMWAIFITISTTACIYLIASYIYSFVQFSVVTETNFVHNNSLIFPQVIFCKDKQGYSNYYRVEKCSFNREDCRNDFDEVNVYDDWGVVRKCLRFNGGKNLTGHDIEFKTQTGETSLYNGLRLELSHSNSTLNFIYINNIGEQPSFYQADFFVNNKASTSISLDRISEVKLPQPYNDCIKNSSDDMVRLTQKFNRFYRHEICLYLCFFKNVAEKNNCSFPGIYTKAFTNCSELINMEKIIQSFHFMQECESCPFECDSVYFNMRINNDNSKKYPNNTFKLYVFYKTLKYTLITQVAKTYYSDLVAQVGGTLGFFIGFRILSTVEIIQFLLETLYIAFTNLKNFLYRKRKINPIT